MSQADAAITYARSQIGKPYSVLPDGINTFDCSLLTQKAWASAGVKIGRDTFAQITNGVAVKKPDLQPGDLVFPDIGHVQLYIGNGEVIEAPHTGAFVRQVAMWGFWQGRRVGEPGAPLDPDAAIPATLVSNPVVDNLLQRVPVLGKLNALATSLSGPAMWRRVGLAGLGLFIIVLGIVFLNRKQIEGQVRSAAKAAELGAVL